MSVEYVGGARYQRSVADVGRASGWPLARLSLDDRGGELGVAMMRVNVRFAWDDVVRAERIRGFVPWDRGVRMVLRGGERFIFYPLSRTRLLQILSMAEAGGVAVDRDPKFQY